MKKLLIAIALAFCMLVHARASAQVQPVSATLTAASTGVCLPTNCLAYSVPSGVGSATFQIGGNTVFSGTVQFEDVLFDGSYYPLNATPSNSATQATSATGPGSWQVSLAGRSTVRMRVTTLASGSVAAAINPSTASARASGGGSGGSGTVTSVTGTANQIDVATGTTTPVVSIDSALQLPGSLSMAQAGALSAAAFTMSGTPITGGSATTTFPLFYQNSGAAPNSWSTAGTFHGINAPSGFSGNFIDYHINGGGSVFSVTSAGTLTAAFRIAAAGIFTATNASLGFGTNAGATSSSFQAPSNGVISVTNAAQTGFTRFSFGGTTSSFPALQVNGANLQVELADGSAQTGLSASTYSTATNCAANGTAANPSVVSCAAAAAGMFSCATNASTGTCQVNTTAVTANSEISIIQDAADGGASQLNVTCETTYSLPATSPLLKTKSAGASFTINVGTITSNPACFQYIIVN